MRTYNSVELCWNWFDEENRLHRIGGPTIEYDEGGGEYRVRGKLHRLDGPAIVCGDEDRNLNEWYINGYSVDYQIDLWAKVMNIDLNNLSEEDKILIAVKWSDYDGY